MTHDDHSPSGMGGTLNRILSAAMAIPHDLERRIEEGLNKTLAILNIPSRDEVRNLQNRLDELIARCDRLIERKGSRGPTSGDRETRET